MKNLTLIFCALFLLQISYAQKDVYLKINHKLGSSSFGFNQTATNNMNNDFQVTRLQYYISNIVLYHDGTQTAVSNKFILANGSTTTNELLGSFNITALDSIAFGIGVGPNENHLDPSTYASSHPLAPQAPSMHWGWTSGYRFIAFEGVAGASMNDLFQMHSLGDNNYKIKTIVTAGQANGNMLEVALDADYTKALEGIDVSSGVISHGETGAAKTVIDNFNAHVFTASANSVSVVKLQDINIAIYPNPVSTKESLFIQVEDAADISILVYDLTGKLYQDAVYSNQSQTIQFKDAGSYIINVLKDGKIASTHKISVYE